MKIGIFTGVTSVRSKNIFTDISRYPTGKHEIKKKKYYLQIEDDEDYNNNDVDGDYSDDYQVI